MEGLGFWQKVEEERRNKDSVMARKVWDVGQERKGELVMEMNSV
jgi:hypothetical protein